MSPAGSAARIFIVKGRVQGVFFRASTRKFADSRGLRGYAVNLPDGDVEVFACGPVTALDELEDWLHDGPPAARVTAVQASEADWRDMEGFTTG